VNPTRRTALLRWSVVAGGVALLCALPVAVAAWPARAAAADPGRLRAAILASAGHPYEGYVDSQGRMGLPSLPQAGDVTGLFSGATSIRVWHASTRSWRVAVVEPTGERDFYSTPQGTYVWDFGRNQLTEIVGDLPVRLPWAPDVVPPELARRLLDGAAPADRLTALPARRIAGITAAGLRLTPADPDTTIGRIDVWADPATGLPLRVDVAARVDLAARGTGGPAFTSRFLDLAQRAPDPAVLTPRAADSAGFVTTTRLDIASSVNSLGSALPESLAGRPRVATNAAVVGVAAYGAGLSRFAVVPIPGNVGAQAFEAVRNAGGAEVPLSRGQGYALGAGLLTVVAVRTRRTTYLLAGLVTPELLTRAAVDLVAVRR
jgi:hypothetical protein